MSIEIIIPKSKSELADGRQLGYDYIEYVGAQSLLRPYFLAQDFKTDVDKMPQGYDYPDGVYLFEANNVRL